VGALLVKFRQENGKETREKMGGNVWKAKRGEGRGMREDMCNANVRNTGKTDGRTGRHSDLVVVLILQHQS